MRTCEVAIVGAGPYGLSCDSIRGFHPEAVFNREDPIPGLMEFALIPYLTFKRGF